MRPFPGAADPFNNPADATGNVLKRTPKFTFNGGVQYTRDVGYGSINVGVNGQYTSKVYYDALNIFAQDGYGVANLILGWKSPDEKLSVTATVKNITNTFYERYLDPIGPTLLVIDAAPRTGLVTIGYKF